MNVRMIMALFYRRKFAMLAFFTCAIVGGYVGLLAVSPVYRATAQLMVNLGQEDVFMPTLPSSSSEVRTPLTVGRVEQRANSEMRIIESEPLAEQVVAKLGPDGLFPGIDERHAWYTPKGMMQRAVDVYRAVATYFYPAMANETLSSRAKRLWMHDLKTETLKDSTVIQVTVDSVAPDIAANSLNELIRLYLQERKRVYHHENNVFFDEQLANLKGKLEQTDRQLEEFRGSNGVIDVDAQREAMLRRMSVVDANLQNEVVTLAGLHRRISVLAQQIDQNPSIAARLRGDLLATQAELGQHEDAISKWTKLRNDLTAQAETLSREQSQSSQLLQRQRVLQDSRKLYLQKVEELRIQQAMRDEQIGDVSVINWAVPDHAPVSPKLGLVLGGVFGVALIGSVALALLLEFLDTRIKNEDDASSATGIPVIGRVPRLARS